jgi:hypothetical protein
VPFEAVKSGYFLTLFNFIPFFKEDFGFFGQGKKKGKISHWAVLMNLAHKGN